MRLLALSLALIAVSFLGCASETSKPAAGGGKSFHLWVHQFEGCECDSVCPCIFSKDTTHGDCRGIMVWQVSKGNAGGVDLAGVNVAAALTKSGTNMEKAMGQWTGILYVSDKATEAQKNAVVDVMKHDMGAAFAKVEVKSAAVEIKREGDHHEVNVGKLGTLKIKGIKGANGQVMTLENPPSPIAPPKLWCAISEVNTYDDGTTKWDFKGRNAFYTDLEPMSK
jgi:hypothetical protein